MPSIDPSTQRLSALLQRVTADGRIRSFEGRAVTRALSEAVSTAPTAAKIDEYIEQVSQGWRAARTTWFSEPSIERRWRHVQKDASTRRRQLEAAEVCARIGPLPVPAGLKEALCALAREGIATRPVQRDLERAYLEALDQCTTAAEVGELYWNTYEVAKNYRREGGPHDAWWDTGAHQTMRERSTEKQMKLDPSIHLNAYNHPPKRLTDWR
ncbi:MAG: hypothetical protein INH41_16395 [Myxococcaceae bacterium]|jgi:hypothetical protein|nr:hypothetical protein [Myxococcaceae bacterium]MCA3013962.1 hypothetical protein [Myxococcaceae bacterium]